MKYIQTLNHDNNSQETRNRGGLQLDRVFSENLPLTSYLIMRNSKLSTEIRNKARMFPLPTAFQHHNRSPSECNRTRRRNKRYTDWGQQETKWSLFTDDMTVYV